ncbi:hypothetical protein [Halalkaliarchaeum desulfuricum]|nr:hypothetical protein [Halalkaliarchaeum desulfuricum]
MDWIGVSPGDRVPDDLLWRFYDLELVYTKTKKRDISEPEFGSTFVSSEGSGGLTETQRVRLRQFIDDYDSSRARTVQQLENLVEGVDYEEHDSGSVHFGDQNPLSEIAKRTHARELQMEEAKEVLEEYNDNNIDREELKDLPDVVLSSIPKFTDGYFQLTQLSLSDSIPVYTFEDDEMWTGGEMVSTLWTLTDERRTPTSPDFEAEFNVDGNASEASGIAKVTIENETMVPFEIDTNWEDETDDYQNNPWVDSRREGFYKHICDCLIRQFRVLPEYDYTGPGLFFEP